MVRLPVNELVAKSRHEHVYRGGLALPLEPWQVVRRLPLALQDF
jgi:hypothetical protein